MFARKKDTHLRCAVAKAAIALCCGVLVLNSFATGQAVAASKDIRFRGVVVGGPTKALSPLESSVVSFSDQAAFRLISTNQEQGFVTVRLQAFSQDMVPLDAVIVPAETSLAPGSSAVSTVIVPLSQVSISKVRICAVHTSGSGLAAKPVCGSYTAKRLVLSE